MDNEILSREEKRKVFVVIADVKNGIKSNPDLNNDIYIQLSLEREKGRIKANAYSSFPFETTNNKLKKPFKKLYYDSNFIGKKEIMPYNDFIEVLAALNNAKVEDSTVLEGILLKRMYIHNSSMIQNFIKNNSEI